MLSAKSWRRRAYQGLIAGLERAGGRVAQVNVGISQATRERIPAVTRIVPCGVDVRRFEPGAKSPQPSILFVGTAGGRKRGAFLAEVFEREIKPLVPEAQLWTVADRDLVGEGIVNYGRVALEELTRLYRSAWVFCLPSTYEGFGVPYIEAMASGTAVVASPNPGAREVLQEGASGTVAPDAELGGAIARLLTDAAVRADFEARGLRRSEDFAWPAVAGAYERIYEQIGSRTGTAA
jgi:glycosyltransferase involved in cell wall biosynthesis